MQPALLRAMRFAAVKFDLVRSLRHSAEKIEKVELPNDRAAEASAFVTALARDSDSSKAKWKIVVAKVPRVDPQVVCHLRVVAHEERIAHSVLSPSSSHHSCS